MLQELTRQRILYICGGRNFLAANPGRKIGGVVAVWRKAGHDVRHICGGDILGTDIASISYGAQEIHKKWYRKINLLQPLMNSFSEQRDIVHDRLVLKHVMKLTEKWSPELVWERSSRLHCSGLIIAKKLGIPYVLEWKDNLLSYNASLFKRRADKLEYIKNTSADFVVVESNVLRNNLMLEGIEAEKILVAHNAVDIDEFARDFPARDKRRRALGIGDKEVLVGYLGSYAFYHDAVRLVLSADILRESNAKGIRILMVGGGKEYPQCRDLAEQRGLIGSTILMQQGVPVREVPEWLSALDIAVLPGSTDIICPIKIQEYMAAGLPTLAPDYPCNREVITDGKTGLLFRPFSEESLAGRIGELVGDASLRQCLGKHAREEVIKRFTWENTWGAALEEVLSKTGRN